MEELIHNILPLIISAIEIIGITVVTVGSFKAFAEYVTHSFQKKDVKMVRHELGEAMVTGLEFKMAAEILRTVLVRSLNEIFILAGIIVLRALLSFLIKRDIVSTEMKCESSNNDGSIVNDD